ncbi:MAG: hypothetical protein FWD61_07770 [Phycisphaerales bacterium]|nr:hypothetical protein [Phycisphaerales bacterium]
MKLHQVSVFLENKPGQLAGPCRALADAGIDILTLSLADTQQFGILRLLVQDWQKAHSVLQSAGCVVNVTEVLALDVPDKPGGLAYVLDILETAKVGIEYMYAFTANARGEHAAIIFRFEDNDLAIDALKQKGIPILGPVELFARLLR